MIKDTAADYFAGRNGLKRLNCAQTIAQIFKDKFDFITDDTVSDFKKKGVGRAPGGECGMVFAAKFILENAGTPDDVAGFEKFFTEFAGSLKCSEIKKRKREFCTLCIKETAGYLDRKLNEN